MMTASEPPARPGGSRGDLHLNAALLGAPHSGISASLTMDSLTDQVSGETGVRMGIWSCVSLWARAAARMPVEGRGNVLIAVARCGGAGVHDDGRRGDAELRHQDVELLGKVDIDGGLCADLLAIGHDGGGATDL